MEYGRANDLTYAVDRLRRLALAGNLRPAEAAALAELEAQMPQIGGAVNDTRRAYSDAGQSVMDAAIWANQNFNPVELIGQSMQSSRRMLAPGRSGWERAADGADMLSNLVEGGAALFGPVVSATSRGVAAIPDVVQTLARGRGYEIGDALRAASAGSTYAPPANKPGLLSLPGLDTKFEARPVSPIEEAAAEYMRGRGIYDFQPLDAYPAFSEDRAKAIALAYADMAHDPSNPAVRRAYDAMIDETLAQYNALKDAGIDFRFLREGMSDPYAASPGLGYKDMVENGRLWVFPTDFGFGTSSGFDPSANPLLKRVGRIGDKPDAVANDAFRVVHDAFGHYGPGNPFFRHQGEERAWVEHSRMYGPEARGAMTSETRGQNSWLNFGPYGEQNRKALGADTVFADQKTGLMPSWTYGLLSPDDERAAIEEFLRRRGM